MSSFQNRVAIVTGSSKGIGRHLAHELARKGARVVLNGRDPAALKTTRDWLASLGFSNTLAIAADLARHDECKSLIDKTLQHFGAIDLLFNNAGLGQRRARIEESTPQSLRLIMEVNTLGPMYVTHYALPHLRASKGGILFTGSLIGIHGIPGFGSYSASKMALTAVAESLRNELKGTGVYVGIAYVGLVKNDEGKLTIGPTGKMEPIGDVHDSRRRPQDLVARQMLRMVERRQFKRYFTGLGKLNMIMNRVSPSFVNWMLGKFA